MGYEVYTISGAPRAWRVLLALVAKEIDFTVHVLDGSKKEHKSPDFLALNPRGRVPVLKNGEFVLTESLAILAYLERAHPSPPLFGTTPKEHARIWQIVSEGVHDLFEHSSSVLRPVFSQAFNEEDEAVKKAAAATGDELTRLERLLASSQFVVSDRFSAADCVCFPQVRLLKRAAERYPDTMRRLDLPTSPDAFPRLADWVRRVESLPGYEKTFPPHWR